METSSNKYEEHSFKSFLEQYHVEIPMIQRDYAQGRTTDDVNRVRNRFLEAIKKYLIQHGPNPAETMKLDFVFGEIEKVWSKSEVGKLDKLVVVPLDGQQRLTTLYLLHWFAAKKAGLNPESYSFLKHFNYGVRPSSRDFCTHLMEFTPSLDESIKKQLTDQYWFMGEWNSDPTVQGMLVMLDAIRDKFSDVDNLWELLTGDPSRIVFYFLPLAENGLSDELYIKMNSRGKKLTPYEHFKAEFEDLYKQDPEKALLINHKFDVEWTDTLFAYRGNDDITDDEFMRYFFYISHILCYQQEVEKSNDEFKLIETLYKDSEKAQENRKYFEKAMDVWYEVMKDYGSIDAFFSKYLSNDHYEEGKVATYKTIEAYHGSQNFFHACIKLYQVNNNFSYSDFLFLYGIITFLMNKDTIDEQDFIIRLRTLRNLIWNSDSGEIRGDADYMKDLLDEVETLMLKDIIKKEPHGFNGIQEDEENEKKDKREQMAKEELDAMYKLEDHPLIYGYVSGFKGRWDLVDAFCIVFQPENYLSAHLAMISIDDYRQHDSSRYFMGNANRSTWTRLLHKSRFRDGFEHTMDVLITMLTSVKGGKSPDDIIKDYTTKCETDQKYPWRYYFAKYPAMNRGAEGEFTWKEEQGYVCIALNRHQYNGKHWYSFLNVIYNKFASHFEEAYGKKVLSLGDYGENLSILHPVSSVAVTEDGFIYYNKDNQEKWKVSQVDGIDEKDRVQFAIEKIEDLVKTELSK